MTPGLLRLLPFVDYPVTSKEFPVDATGEKNLLKALPQLQRKYGSRAVCATIGVDGALAWDGTRFWYAPSYKVRVVDTTGAGDLFHAAFSYGILHHWDRPRRHKQLVKSGRLRAQSGPQSRAILQVTIGARCGGHPAEKGWLE